MEIAIIIVSVCYVFLAHWIACLKVTSAHRFAMIALAGKSETYLAMAQLDALEGMFDAHFRRVVTFRDPWVIYPMVLKPIVKDLKWS